MKLTKSKLQQIIKEELNSLLVEAVLRRGSRGAEVQQLQQQLKDFGFGSYLGTSGPNKDGVDGRFGGGTKKAVEAFQRDANLEDDGIVGKNTTNALNVVSTGRWDPKTAMADQPIKGVGSAKTAAQAKQYLDRRDKERAAAAAKVASKKQEPAAEKPEETGSILSRVQNKIRNTFQPLIGIPLHLKSMTDFISLRDDPMTEKELSKKDLELLSQFLTWRQVVGGRGDRKDFNLNYGDYKEFMKAQGDHENVHSWLDPKSMGKLNKIMTKVWPTNRVNHLQLSFGQAKVVDRGDHYELIDTYNFNKVDMMPEKYKSWKNLPSSVWDDIGAVFGGKPTEGVENILSWAQKAGYKGFPVRLRIPKAGGTAEVSGTRLTKKGQRVRTRRRT